MTFGRSIVAVALAVVVAPACGNYSNEDLEYMSAIPERDDVAIEVPRRGLVTLGAAEGWRTTVEVTRALNRTADAFLGLIEKIRHTTPTKRQPDERIWGPFPADDHPGWQLEFRMQRMVADGETAAFTYALVMIPPAGAPDITIIGGSFAASGGVRVGEGEMLISLVDAHAAGLVFKDLDTLRTLTIEYRTRTWPRMVTMTIENEPSDTEPGKATYSYERAENGDGAMTFTVFKDLIAGPLGAETLSVESRWLGTGPGRADTSVTGGDVVGEATAVECWGDDFQSSYKAQTWDPAITGNEVSCVSRL